MEKLLYVNACVRPEGISRTKKLADEVLKNILTEAKSLGREISVEQVDVSKLNLEPLDWKRLEHRSNLVSNADYDDSLFDLAKQFSAADEILIAAPFWDMSFPAILKIYFENISVSGLTFFYNEQNEAVGLCKAKKVHYVTTAGGKMYYNGGFEYVKGLCSSLFGIKEFEQYSRENLDI